MRYGFYRGFYSRNHLKPARCHDSTNQSEVISRPYSLNYEGLLWNAEAMAGPNISMNLTGVNNDVNHNEQENSINIQTETEILASKLAKIW